MNTLAQSATNKKMLKQPSFRLAMAGLKFAENRGAHKEFPPEGEKMECWSVGVME
jgi:hypothetical protein